MAIIIKLPSRGERQDTVKDRPIPAGGATILLFMGVRYERHDGRAAAAGKTSRRARQKKRA
jgi:hypothetical protein